MGFPGIQQYIKLLENAIFNLGQNYEIRKKYLTEIDEELSNELGDSLTYRKKYSFGKHYDTILQKSNSFVRNVQSRMQRAPKEENSRYYSPNLSIWQLTICHYALYGPECLLARLYFQKSQKQPLQTQM